MNEKPTWIPTWQTMSQSKTLNNWYDLLNENQEPPQLHGHGPWLMCEVALSGTKVPTHAGLVQVKLELPPTFGRCYVQRVVKVHTS